MSPSSETSWELSILGHINYMKVIHCIYKKLNSIQLIGCLIFWVKKKGLKVRWEMRILVINASIQLESFGQITERLPSHSYIRKHYLSLWHNESKTLFTMLYEGSCISKTFHLNRTLKCTLGSSCIKKSSLLSSCVLEKKKVKLILSCDSLQHLMAKFKAEYLAPERCPLFIILILMGESRIYGEKKLTSDQHIWKQILS